MSMIKCDKCNRLIDSDYLYFEDVDGTIVCDNCFTEEESDNIKTIVEYQKETERKAWFKLSDGREFRLIGNVIMKWEDGALKQIKDRQEFHEVDEILLKYCHEAMKRGEI